MRLVVLMVSVVTVATLVLEVALAVVAGAEPGEAPAHGDAELEALISSLPRGALDAVRAAGHQAWDVGEIVDGHGRAHVDRR